MVNRQQSSSPSVAFRLGDRVLIKYDGRGVARVVELRGPLGPNGEMIDRVALPTGVPKTRVFIEVRGDPLRLAPPPNEKTSSTKSRENLTHG